MESEQLLLSIGLGIGIGFAYVAATYLSNKRAMHTSRSFMLLVVSTMMLRMLIALMLIIGIVVMLPVSDVAFLGSFFVIFVLGLISEIWMLHRRQTESGNAAVPDGSQSEA